MKIYSQAELKEMGGAQIETKHVIKRIHRWETCSGPGPSGLRPDHLRAVLSAPGGAGVLTTWSRRWARCLVPVAVAAQFAGYVTAPLNKQGGGIRPIAMGELLPKLAAGSAVEALEADIMRAMNEEVRERGELCGSSRPAAEAGAQYIMLRYI